MTTLLAIDDSKTMRKVLEITFAGEDYQTVLAASADDALAKLRSEKPAVVLVDHDLGGQSGYDLCQRIKSEAPGTRVLILSSKQHPYDSSRGTAAGADEHMDKPFDTQQMLDKVGNMLRAAPAQPSVQAAVTAPAPAAHAAPPMSAPAVVAAKPRSQTLAYGTPAPSPAAQAAPPPQAAPPAPQPGPVRTQTYPGTPAVTPRPAPVAQKPVVSPSPAAPPVAPAPRAVAPAPAAVAAPAPAVAAHTGNGSELAGKLQGLGLNPSQVEAVLALSREVVEQVVWEVVPVLAETIIQEEIRRLTQEG